MIKKTIAYTDYNGQDKSLDAYFNMTQAEIIKLEMSVHGGFKEHIERAIAAEDGGVICDAFEKLIDLSYGVKTFDGGFVKRPVDLEAFKATPAYSKLFVEIVTNADKAGEFVNGIIPTAN